MAHPSIINSSVDSFAADVLESPVPVLVDFWAEWCGPCKMLGPVLDDLAGEFGASMRIVKVDVDAADGQNRSLAAQYGVKNIPTLLFVQGGEVKERVNGAVNRDQLLTIARRYCTALDDSL